MNIDPHELAKFRVDFKKMAEELREKYDVTTLKEDNRFTQFICYG